MEFLLWIASIVVAITVWEYLHMGMDWWGILDLREWSRWGMDEKSAIYRWSLRLGPIQIYRM